MATRKSLDLGVVWRMGPSPILDMGVLQNGKDSENLWFWTFPCFESKVLPSNIRKQAIPKNESTTRNRPKSTAEPFRAKFNFPNVSENGGILQNGNVFSVIMVIP
jgi:hypothetical protein